MQMWRASEIRPVVVGVFCLSAGEVLSRIQTTLAVELSLTQSCGGSLLKVRKLKCLRS
jgi:hypothetical protein